MNELFSIVLLVTVLLVGIPIGLFIIVSPFIFLYWFFNPDVAHRSWFVEDGGLSLMVYISTASVCFGIIYIGAKSALSSISIPRHWADAVGFPIGIATTGFLVYVFTKFEELRAENRSMRTELEIEKWKKKVKYLPESELKERLTEFRQRLKKLEKLDIEKKNGLSGDEKNEKYLLNALLAEFNSEIINREFSKDEPKQ